MADTEKTPKPKGDIVAVPAPVCGIVMPIAGDGDYTDDHWRRVQRIIVRSIEKAGMSPRLVWENPEVDVIHARILQGIYESDVVICDVSGLNPNVMLELGLRLSTKRPTVVITDGVKKPPFDIGVFQYHSYQRDLEYNAVDAFIDEIGKKLGQVHAAFEDKRYKSFVENFTFEVVEPTEVSIPADVAIRDRMDAFSRQLSRVENVLAHADGRQETRREGPLFSFETYASDEIIKAIVEDIAVHRRAMKVSTQSVGSKTVVTIVTPSTIQPQELTRFKQWVQAIVDRRDDVPF